MCKGGAVKTESTSNDNTVDSKAALQTGPEADDNVPKLVPGFVYRHFLHEDAKVSKLVTREDNYHIHKTLGILSLVSFCYRYGYVYMTQGNLGFDGMDASRDSTLIMIDWLTMIVHTMLALSSIIFRVPRKRISNKPMVIYEEYRQHAMVFTMRCFSVFLVVSLCPKELYGYVVPIVVMAHHLLADRITSIWGTPNNTAVRATSGALKLSNFYNMVAKLYSLYQFMAIASHILPCSRLGDMAYNAIIAIQSSAFMMTLYRKRIVRGRTHMVVYALCLAISAFHIVRSMGLYAFLLTIAAFVVRTNLPRALSSKYAIWAGFLAVANWQHLVGVVSQIVAEKNYSFPALFSQVPEVKYLTIAAVVYCGFVGERLLFEEPSSTARAASSKHEKEEEEKED